MLLTRWNSSSRPFSSSAIPAAIALALASLVPSLAHADDEGTAANVDESVDAPVKANESRPLTMRDLGATSSIGVQAGGSMTQQDLLSGKETLYTGALTLDGELALGDHVKLYASFPLTAAKDSESDSGIAGRGNVTLGAQLQGGSGQARAAIGGSVSRGADSDGSIGIVMHMDIPTYYSVGTALHGFASLRGGDDDRFVQAEIGLTHLSPDHQTSNDLSRDPPEVGSATVGAGMRLTGGPMLLGEVGIMHQFNRDVSNVVVADIGLRGRFMPDSKATWATKASLMHVDDLTSIGIGLELRTDLPGISGK